MHSNYEDFTDDLDERDSRTRSREVNGRTYTIQCTDPYGHWHVVGGGLPEVLKGSWTSIEKLWSQIEHYEANRAVAPEKTIVSTDGKGGRKRIPQNSTLEG